MATTWRRLRERLVNFYPPFLGAGIRSRDVDQSTMYVEMKLTWFNVNLVGVHFGGSLYAMCDPWFMLILMRQPGKDYIVWDKAASIQFLRPGRGRAKATFHIPQERVDEIRGQTDIEGKVEPAFTVDVTDDDGQVIARVEKTALCEEEEIAFFRAVLGGYNQIMKKLRPRVRALKLAREVRKRLTDAVGQPVEVIMFGSQARGDATRESDIDLLVILPSTDKKMVSLASDIAWEVGFDAGKIISAIPDTKENMKRYSFLPFYRTIRQEGIIV